MKKILSLILTVGAAVAVHAQGTFNPGTFNSDPNFNHGGGTVTDQLAANAPLFGNGYQGQYYIGPSGTTDPNALVAVGPVTGFMGASAVDPAAGYYNGDGSGAVTVSGTPGGTQVVLQLRAWKGGAGSTYAAATDRGGSGLISIALGNVGSPASLPTAITTMQNFAIGGPEPATIALGLMGAGALFIRRRK
jgi:hypothetical protein